MLRKTLLSLLLLLPACDFCVDNASRVLGGDVFCRHGGSNTALCYSQSRGKGYVCFTGQEEHGQAVCLEGLPPALEATK